MKEKIFKYLLEAGIGVAPDQILRDVLSIQSPDPHSAYSILAGFLKQDPRFVFIDGLWRLSSPPAEPAPFDFSQAVVLHLQSSNRAETLRCLRGAVRLADGRFQEFTDQASAKILKELCAEIDGRLFVVWSNRELRLWNSLLQSKNLDVRPRDVLYLRSLAARALKRMPPNLQPEDLASELGLSPADEERPTDVVRYLSTCWLLLLDRIPAESRRNLGVLREWMERGGPAVDFSRFTFGPGFLRGLPGASGVYIMKDREDAVLYVGKSRNLKRRVSSYFVPRALNQPKIARIHERLHSIEVRSTDNEVEALLTEMRLIKEFHPPVNLQIEIHESKAGRREGCNILLFVVEGESRGVRIYFLHNGVFAGRHSASLGRPPAKRLQERIKTLFFGRAKSRKKRGENWEMEIVSRWLSANQRRLNCLDVDEAADFADVLNRLRHYLCDPDKLQHKVYYR